MTQFAGLLLATVTQMWVSDVDVCTADGTRQSRVVVSWFVNVTTDCDCFADRRVYLAQLSCLLTRSARTVHFKLSRFNSSIEDLIRMAIFHRNSQPRI